MTPIEDQLNEGWKEAIRLRVESEALERVFWQEREMRKQVIEENAGLRAQLEQMAEALEDASECVRKALNGEQDISELDPQGWDGLISAYRSQVQTREVMSTVRSERMEPVTGAGATAEQSVAPASSDTLWRKLLWLRHGCPMHALYGDDGKMDCNRCLIDFRKDSPEQMQARWQMLAYAAMRQEKGNGK